MGKPTKLKPPAQPVKAGGGILKYLNKPPGSQNPGDNSGPNAGKGGGRSHDLPPLAPGLSVARSMPLGHLRKSYLDNSLLSQDLDDSGIEVVWCPSPGTKASLGLEKSLGKSASVSCLHALANKLQESSSQIGASAAPEGGVLAPSSQTSREEMKKALIEMVRAPRPSAAGNEAADVEAQAAQAAHVNQGVQTPPAQIQGSQDLLEEILAGIDRPMAAGSTSPPKLPARSMPVSAFAAMAGAISHMEEAGIVPAGNAPPLGGQLSDEAVLQQVLADAKDSVKTPGPHTIMKLRRAAGTSTCKRSGERSTGQVARNKRPLAPNERHTSGQKRRVLLELLDQVELMVKARDTGADEDGSPAAHFAGKSAPPTGMPSAGKRRAMGLVGMSRMHSAPVVDPLNLERIHSHQQASTSGAHASGTPPAGSKALHGRRLGLMDRNSKSPLGGGQLYGQLRGGPPAGQAAGQAPVATLQPAAATSTAGLPPQKSPVAGAMLRKQSEQLLVNSMQDLEDFLDTLDMDMVEAQALQQHQQRQQQPTQVQLTQILLPTQPKSVQHAPAQAVQQPVVAVRSVLQDVKNILPPQPAAAVGIAPKVPVKPMAVSVQVPVQVPPPAAALAASGSKPGLLGSREDIHFVVLEVQDGQQEKLVRLMNQYKGQEVWAHLSDLWHDLPVQPGDTLNLIAPLTTAPDGSLHASCTSSQGMAVLHPDVLLSGTTITSAMDCTRKAWIQELFGGSSSDKAVLGTLQHELVQYAMVAAMEHGALDAQQLEQQALAIAAASAGKLLEVGLTEAAAVAEMRTRVPAILEWLRVHVGRNAGPGHELRFGPNHKGPSTKLALTGIADIEENIWAPRFGLKGQLDATLHVVLESQPNGSVSVQPRGGRFSDPGRHMKTVASGAAQPMRHSWAAGVQSAGGHNSTDAQAAGASSRQSMLVPFEFKSGRHHHSHRAQVSLYLLLMEDRYGQPCDTGVLWNVHDGPIMHAVQRVQGELGALMMHRNRLAAHMVGTVRTAPAMLHDSWQCGRCYAQSTCALYHKAMEGGDGGSSGLDPGQWHRLTSHLAESHCTFFAHWMWLVEVEEASSREAKNQLWAVAGEEREAVGDCLANLAYKGYCGPIDVPSGTRHAYDLELATSKLNSQEDGPAIFAEGDMALLGIDGHHANVARVVVGSVTKDTIRLLSKKELKLEALVANIKQPAGSNSTDGHSTADAQAVSWRLDKDNPTSMFNNMRANLVELMGGSRPTAPRQRARIVDQEPPECNPIPCSQVALDGSMNEDQRSAVSAVLQMQDYVLILGMPGTGKTSTIVHAIRGLLAAGKTVLLTAYTNSAVDNIALKLVSAGIDFVRVPGGSEQAVHPDIRPFIPGGDRYPDGNTMNGLTNIMATVRVVAVTCLGIKHPLLAHRTFDVCILDEASQVSLPACLGPLSLADSFVLVGDHYQLPPLVTSPLAAAQGFGQSLFLRLCEAHPQAVVTLRRQYRMAAPIMALSNTLVYNGALMCGSDAVAGRSMQLPLLAQDMSRPAWLAAVLDPATHAVFVNTDGIPSCLDVVQHDAVSNPGEAQLVLQVVQHLMAAGAAAGDIGVVSPYRAQVSLLEQTLRATGGGGVEVLTIDKCQGRDKECIVISFVRANTLLETGRLLTNWQRVNVALTRAKSKLIMVGSASTLACVPMLSAMLGVVAQCRLA